MICIIFSFEFYDWFFLNIAELLLDESPRPQPSAQIMPFYPVSA